VLRAKKPGKSITVSVHELEQQLPALTRGEAVLDCAFDRYQVVGGRPPVRPRSDHNPLNRKEYLLHVQRRVGRQRASGAGQRAGGAG
jgi:ribosomal protection tetracycline resistance protein